MNRKVVLSLSCLMAFTPIYANDINEADIQKALREQSVIVHAKVKMEGLRGKGMRNERIEYTLTQPVVLLKGDPIIPLWTTYAFSQLPELETGEYVLILQPGPYRKAEKVKSNSPRFAEIKRSITHVHR